MAELFQIANREMAQPIDEFPFQDEFNDLVPFIKEKPEILGGTIEVLEEQLDIGGGGNIHLLALDRMAGIAQITLIELKNEVAQQHVLLKALRYASWVKNNPASLKHLLKKKGLSIKNIDFNPKIMIVAPQIDPVILELSQYIQAFEFAFIEIRRFGTADNCFLIADYKTLPKISLATARPKEYWGWDKYGVKLGVEEKEIGIGRSVLEKMRSICEEKPWNITTRFNRYYISFKHGTKNMAYITYEGRPPLCYLGFRLGESPEKLGLIEPYPDLEHGYSEDYGYYRVRIDEPDSDISGYIPFMEAAYRHITKDLPPKYQFSDDVSPGIRKGNSEESEEHTNRYKTLVSSVKQRFTSFREPQLQTPAGSTKSSGK